MKKFFKKILVCGLILSATLINVSAQEEKKSQKTESDNVLEHRHELKLGVGFCSTITNFATLTMFPSFTETRSFEDILLLGITGVIPQFNVAYDYRISKVFAIGAEVTSNFETYHTAGVTMDFYYLSKPKFSVYGNLGVCAILCTEGEKFNQIFPTFGIYPLGLKFGKNAGGFIEVGYGHKGILNFGAFIKLFKQHNG